MKKLYLFLLALMCSVSMAWGAVAPVGTVLWGETFESTTDAGSDVALSKYDYSGRTCYGADVTYSVDDADNVRWSNSSATGVSGCNLWLKKQQQKTFTTSAIDLGGATRVSFEFTRSKGAMIVSWKDASGSTWNVIYNKPSMTSTVTTASPIEFDIPNGVTSINIKIQEGDNSNNLRVDNIALKVVTAGSDDSGDGDGDDDTPSITAESTLNLTTAEDEGTFEVTWTGMEDMDVSLYTDEACTSSFTGSWFQAELDGDNNVYYVVEENTTTSPRTVYMQLYGIDEELNDYFKVVAVTQVGVVLDYVTLPWVWNGGTKVALNANAGVSTDADDKDYADTNAPYYVKFNGEGKYLQIKTNERIGLVTIGVKMIGGANTSTMDMVGSADGETWSDVIESFTIAGNTNDVVTLQSTKQLPESYRYVKFIFHKGSNIGVGPISVAAYVAPATVSVTSAGYATYAPATDMVVTEEDAVFYASNVTYDAITFTAIAVGEKVKAGEGLLVKGEGNHDFIPTSDATSLGETNKLHGVLTSTDLSAVANAYVLAMQDNGVAAFCPVSGGSLAAGKAYLVRPAAPAGAPSVMRITFETEETETATDIENIEAEQTVKFIENGQLIIIKNGVRYNALGQVVR